MSDVGETPETPPVPAPVVAAAPVASVPDPGGTLDLEDPARRRFLGLATGVIAAGTGAAALAPCLAALFSPLSGASPAGRSVAVDLGPLEAFEPGVPRKVTIRAARTDGYVREGERALGSVVVVRRGVAADVLAATCPHLGCDVSPVGEAIVCPCHESRFSLDGTSLAGPSPRPLDRLEAHVESGRLVVRFERFQVGTPEKRAL